MILLAMFHQRKNLTEANPYSTKPEWKGLLQLLGETKWSSSKYTVKGMTELEYNTHPRNAQQLIQLELKVGAAPLPTEEPAPLTMQQLIEEEEENGDTRQTTGNTQAVGEGGEEKEDEDDGDGVGLALGGVLASTLKKVGKPYDYTTSKAIEPNVIRYDRCKLATDMFWYMWVDGGDYNSIRSTVIEMINNRKEYQTWNATSSSEDEEIAEQAVQGVPNVEKQIDWACEHCPEFKHYWTPLTMLHFTKKKTFWSTA